MSNQKWYVVQLEFERVQTYLFAVNELKSMLGANTKLGEVLRGCLSGHQPGQRTFLACLADPSSSSKVDNLPALAMKHGAAIPNDVDVRSLGLPEGNRVGINNRNDEDWDDPQSSYRCGVLARDGGHFSAAFADADKATQFIVSAHSLIARELPGILVNSRLLQLVRADEGWRENPDRANGAGGETTVSTTTQGLFPRTVLPLDWPPFHLCEVSPQHVASFEMSQHGEIRRISREVRIKEEATDRFNRGESYDVLGMLRGQMLGEMETGKRREPPSDFGRIAQSGYLAVIAADGNAVGKQARSLRDKCSSGDFFHREAAMEAFFYGNRKVVREAVVKATQTTFFSDNDERTRIPFRFLMLGGDDLLLACDAIFGPRFLFEYARALKNLKSNLTIGAGMAIVKAKFPFHRAHALVEQLTASAKRIYRERENRGEPACSCVDWLLVPEAWHDDVETTRRRQSVRTYRYGDGPSEIDTIILSGKPYVILDEDRGAENLSFERLLELSGYSIEDISSERPLPARSLMKALAEVLPRGRRGAEWLVKRTGDEKLNKLLTELHEANGNKGNHAMSTPWQELGQNRYLTYWLDLMESYELGRLLRHRRKNSNSESR